MSPALQRSFDDLGTPLHDVTFCVIDLETTGSSPQDDLITEVGAVKLRGGECLGTFQTLVNPGRGIPGNITVLTGITEAMVLPAPRIETVLPSLLEFIGDAVIVGHNIRFDLSFLAAALRRDDRPVLRNRSVDTCALARRLVRDEVPNCKLGTLSQRFRLPHRPTHRALDDALATGDLLHVLLERAAGLGVTGLDDLLGLPTMGGHEQAGKLALTTSLPRSPGVYLFRDHTGTVLYVGKATNLRARVRSYFSTDERRKTGRLLRETVRIDHEVCAGPLEAAVREVRLIHRLQPRYNRQAKTWGKYAYLKLTLGEAFPRLSVVRDWKDDGAFYLGPLPSVATAKRVAEAIETVLPLRRCTQRLNGRRPVRDAPCAPAQLGVATCPCAGTVTVTQYDAIVARALRALTGDPDVVLAPLAERMHTLAATERFEEAADVRDRGAALTQALRRQRRIDALRRAGRLVIESEAHGGACLVDGRLTTAWAPGTPAPWAGDAPTLDPSTWPAALGEPAPGTDGLPVPAGEVAQPRLLPSAVAPPCPKDLADELLCVASWLDAQAHRIRITHCDEGLVSRLPRLRSFEPRNALADR